MTVWLFGDSIFRGAAIGRFPEDYAPEEAAAEPLWPMRSPAAVMNLLLGEETVAFGGVTGLPDGVDKAVRELSERLYWGPVAPADTLVFLDVGQHAEDPDVHEAQWRALRQAAVADHPVRLIMCGGFDNGARGRAVCMHDRPINGRSANDALLAAATAPTDDRGVTCFLPLAAPLLAYHHRLKGRFGATAYRRDGVHLNVWGQLKLCALILDAALPAAPLDRGALEAFLAERWAAMGARSREAALAIGALALQAEAGAPEDTAQARAAAGGR